MNNERHYDVLVVGCGPTGATLANLLRAKGHKVAIFDRDPEIFHAPRAMVLDAESCRIYQGMNIINRLMERDASPYHLHRFVNKRRKTLMMVDTSGARTTIGHPPGGIMFHQPALERFLRDDFALGVGVDSYLGYEVSQIQSGNDHAKLIAKNVETGEENEFSGRFLVGADGGASLSRRTIGAKRIDMNYSRKWIVTDAIVHDDVLWDSFEEGSEFKCLPGGAVVFVKGHHNHVRFDFEAGEELANRLTQKDAFAMIGEYFDTSSVEIIRMEPYNFYAGMPDVWRKGRIFLAGDAAHQTSPFSGQGLNMGVRDAANLAFKFDMVFRGVAGEKLLDTYQEERWTNCEHLIRGASARGQMISVSSRWAVLKRNFQFFLGNRAKKFGSAATKRMSNFKPYTDGLLGKTHILSGQRSIQPEVQAEDGHKLLLDQLLGDNFALLSRNRQTGDGISWFEKVLGARQIVIGQDLNDSTGKLGAYFDEHEISSLLIRPDRYIFDAGTDGEKLCLTLREKLADYPPQKPSQDELVRVETTAR